MEVTAVTSKETNNKEEEYKKISTNKRKKLKYYKIIVYNLQPTIPSEFQKKLNKPQKPKQTFPGVGVGVFLIDSIKNTLLLGKRKESGKFGLPGGWLELGEEWEDCAARELKEETGLIKPNYAFNHVYTLNCRKMDFNYHNISCIMMYEISEFEVDKIYNPEPHKCYGWFWTSMDQIRKNINRLFHPLQDFLLKFPQIQSANDIKNMVKTFNVKKTFN